MHESLATLRTTELFAFLFQASTRPPSGIRVQNEIRWRTDPFAVL